MTTHQRRTGRVAGEEHHCLFSENALRDSAALACRSGSRSTRGSSIMRNPSASFRKYPAMTNRRARERMSLFPERAGRGARPSVSSQKCLREGSRYFHPGVPPACQKGNCCFHLPLEIRERIRSSFPRSPCVSVRILSIALPCLSDGGELLFEFRQRLWPIPLQTPPGASLSRSALRSNPSFLFCLVRSTSVWMCS